jgi:long-subunit acyl-CoA synthetase (AMP-forming)
MTENFGGFTLMPADQHKPHTVGKPMPGAEGKIDPDTGEVLMKLPWVMKGYYKDPELTAQTIKDGWLHTGDKGTMDDEGFIKIIGRVKDTFKTSKGKFVVPTEIEDHFADNKYIEQICVAGLGIPQPVALVCLSEIGMKAKKEQLSRDFTEVFSRVNKTLHSHERLSAMVVVKEHWSDENKMLTPTLKIRRNAINERYQNLISEWCDSPEQVIWES